MERIKWIFSAIPRAPRRAGLLMRLYYRWFENFTPAGHAAAALMMLAMFAGIVPGFWAAWIFCGLDFLFFLALVPSLFLTSKKNRFEFGEIVVAPAYEGGETLVHLTVMALNQMDAVSLGCFRMDPGIKCTEPELRSLAMGETANLQCKLHVGGRGAYRLSKVAAIVPEIQGMLRWAASAGSAELLVFPRPVKIQSFAFLTSGAGGMAFAPLLMPSLTRGLDFVGVREYREGDSLRDLHHKAFARYGRPFTKEFETERGAGAVLVLDVSAETVQEKSILENLIRMAAGVGVWFVDRGILGRFFVNDEEIAVNNIQDLFVALSRIPRSSLVKTVKKHLWSPAARPMGPVLRMGLRPETNSLVHKQIVVADLSKSAQSSLASSSSAHSRLALSSDDVLFVDASLFSLKNANLGKEVSL